LSICFAAAVAVSPAQSRLLECYKMNYYNDFDKKACAWLRELIKAGLIPDGVVDERSITDVTADDLCGFTQCHFFAGIGGWSRALQIAGWPEDKPVWTGSCPCQPFSTAGKGNGKSDERHLWPAFAKLISECRPPVVFGEQVESAIKHGWIDDLQADMEREDYAVGFAVLGAHSVGAPHIRQRLYWVANAESRRNTRISRDEISKNAEDSNRREKSSGLSGDGICCFPISGVADSNSKQTVATDQRRFYTKSLCNSDFIRMADSSKPGLERFSGDGDGSDKSRRELQKSAGSVAEGCEFSRVENTSCLGWRGGNTSLSGGGECSQQIEGHSDMGWLANADSNGLQPRERNNSTTGHGDPIAAASCNDRQGSTCQINSIWATPDWLYCRDGKWRPVESGTFPLADGIPGRVGLLRGYGNAIVPQVAAEFIGAFMEASQ